MSCCIKRQLFIRKLDIRTVYVKEIEIFREISLFFLSFFALVEKGDVQMKQYIGIKVVAARPMTRGDYNIFRGWQIPADEDPADEGYVMKHENGHVQWLPKDMFESDYKEYDESTLPATAIGMVSSDYKECFQAEYKQLRIRYEKLKRMLKKCDEGTLELEPVCPRSLYDMQINAMSEYIAVLEARASIERINSQ